MTSLNHLQDSSGIATINSSPTPTMFNSTTIEPSTCDERGIPGSDTATEAVSTISHTTMPNPPRTFRYQFSRLPAEIRYLIYECLVAHRVINVLKDSNYNLGTDAILQLVTCEQNERDGLGGDIKTWIRSRKDHRFDTEIGLWEPSTAVFSATFAHVPYSKASWKVTGRRNPMEPLLRKDAIAWDKFSSSRFVIENVQRIRLDLHRHVIFIGRQSCMESFKTDLRSISHLRHLERIDIDCDTVAYLDEGWQHRPQENRLWWCTMLADEVLRRIWRTFWRYGGWCHPGRACTCCALPEIRLRGYGKEWQILDFEPEAPETDHERRNVFGFLAPMQYAENFDRFFGMDAASVQQWVMMVVKLDQKLHEHRQPLVPRLGEIVGGRSRGFEDIYRSLNNTIRAMLDVVGGNT